VDVLGGLRGGRGAGALLSSGSGCPAGTTCCELDEDDEASPCGEGPVKSICGGGLGLAKEVLYPPLGEGVHSSIGWNVPPGESWMPRYGLLVTEGGYDVDRVPRRPGEGRALVSAWTEAEGEVTAERAGDMPA